MSSSYINTSLKQRHGRCCTENPPFIVFPLIRLLPQKARAEDPGRWCPSFQGTTISSNKERESGVQIEMTGEQRRQGGKEMSTKRQHDGHFSPVQGFPSRLADLMKYRRRPAVVDGSHQIVVQLSDQYLVVRMIPFFPLSLRCSLLSSISAMVRRDGVDMSYSAHISLVYLALHS